MHNELEDNQEDYCYLAHEYWCDLLSKIEAKDNRNRSATQIKEIEFSKSDSLSDSNEYLSIPRKKKARTGVHLKQQGKNNPKQHSAKRYCVLLNKAVLPAQKYMSHNSEECFGKHSDQKYTKDGLGGPMESREKAVKQYKEYENKWKEYLKDLEK